MAGSIERTSIKLPFAELPLLVARGPEAGPVLGIVSGIHGDEYEGPAAIYRFFDALDVAALKGTIIAMPVANPPAFGAISRTSPLDGENLARVFPGDPQGTPSQVIADVVTRTVIQPADFLIDLHTGGVRYAMPTMAGYYTADPSSRAAAEAFGAPVIWGHHVIPPGRTLSVALQRGIPFLYTEGRGGGRVDAEDAGYFERGLWNLARHLGMMPGELVRVPLELHLLGDGNTDRGTQASGEGFFVPAVPLLARVERGMLIGTLLDYSGVARESVFAEQAGVVAMLRLSPAVKAGESLYLIARVG
jgi:predicted deacylase